MTTLPCLLRYSATFHSASAHHLHAQSDFDRSIPESTANGTLLFTVAATDVDEGSNGQVRYVLVENSGDGFAIIDETTGEVHTAIPVDFEEQTSYSFQVFAEDMGDTPRRSAVIDVTVTITDENDNAPIFANATYSTRLPLRIDCYADISTAAYWSLLLLVLKSSRCRRLTMTLVPMDKSAIGFCPPLAFLSASILFKAPSARLLPLTLRIHR